MKIKKFTFKKNVGTGRYAAFQPTTYDIKMNKMWVGSIHSDLKIRLMVVKDDINEDGNPNCTWKWITLSKNFENIDECKTFLNDNVKTILEKFNLHFSSY